VAVICTEREMALHLDYNDMIANFSARNTRKADLKIR